MPSGLMTTLSTALTRASNSNCSTDRHGNPKVSERVFKSCSSWIEWLVYVHCWNPADVEYPHIPSTLLVIVINNDFIGSKKIYSAKSPMWFLWKFFLRTGTRTGSVVPRWISAMQLSRQHNQGLALVNLL